ncbi:MAG: DUF6882 domain-containing protein, partial [Bryobacteraceae bacterium]
MTDEQFAEYKHDAVHELIRLNDECEQRFRIGSWPRYDYDLDEATLTFSDGGVPGVIAEVQAVGSTSHASETWLWSWDNESLNGPSTSRMAAVREYGEVENIDSLTTALLADNEFLGWQMAAIACRVLGGKG